jgi:hypothetical protein
MVRDAGLRCELIHVNPDFAPKSQRPIQYGVGRKYRFEITDALRELRTERSASHLIHTREPPDPGTVLFCRMYADVTVRLAALQRVSYGKRKDNVPNAHLAAQNPLTRSRT